MSHPPPYTSRMKNKNKVSLCSESDTSAVSLTHRFSPRKLSGQRGALPTQSLSTVSFQQFPALTHWATQLVNYPFKISNRPFFIFLPSIFLPVPPLRPMRSFAVKFPILTVNNGN
jgi:hypothetical protein